MWIIDKKWISWRDYSILKVIHFLVMCRDYGEIKTIFGDS
jgi:hypothetical protein